MLVNVEQRIAYASRGLAGHERSNIRRYLMERFGPYNNMEFRFYQKSIKLGIFDKKMQLDNRNLNMEYVPNIRIENEPRLRK